MKCEYLCAMKMLEEKVFSITNTEQFEEVALEVFRYQVQNNHVYREYLELLKFDVNKVTHTCLIPFLPIQLFKTKKIHSAGRTPVLTFTSSGTTGAEISTHLIVNPVLYEKSFLTSFRMFYGNPEDYCILALLPSYLERQGSSLVYMVDRLIKKSNHSDGGFYLNEYKKLTETLNKLESQGQKVLLIGVTFALADLAEQCRMSLRNTVIMETGGMKGRRKEMIREELHSLLCNAFGVEAIHSEYGMTELLSQAYSKGKGIFKCPSWMKVSIRDPYDPFSQLPVGRNGAINVIDLANIYSCSFIQTDDLGRIYPDGSFEVLGRLEGSQIRGCNLLISA